MDVNSADVHDLLSATVAVEVVFAEDNTPRPFAAQQAKRNTTVSTITDQMH